MAEQKLKQVILAKNKNCSNQCPYCLGVARSGFFATTLPAGVMWWPQLPKKLMPRTLEEKAAEMNDAGAEIIAPALEMKLVFIEGLFCDQCRTMIINLDTNFFEGKIGTGTY